MIDHPLMSRVCRVSNFLYRAQKVLTLICITVFCASGLLAQDKVDCRQSLLKVSEGIVHQMNGKELKIPFSQIPIDTASLYAAHRTGYLPERDFTWELPLERGIINLETQRIGKSSRKHISTARDNRLKITWNKSTETVIEACANMSRATEPWMTPEVVEGYKHLYRLGYIYSLELWSPDGELVAASFGVISNGHVQGISKYRNREHPLSNGGGHVLASAMKYYFWQHGLKVFDEEVFKVAGTKAKNGVEAESYQDFQARLNKMNSEDLHFFDLQENSNGPFQPVESDFFDRFQEMSSAGNYFFDKDKASE